MVLFVRAYPQISLRARQNEEKLARLNRLAVIIAINEFFLLLDQF